MLNGEVNNNLIKLEPSWKALLAEQFNKEYMRHLKQFLLSEKKSGKRICPKGPDYFNAFTYTPVSNVKVVLLGQDPYHGLGQAHGLSFSVKPGVRVPPSLQNIYKELASDLNITPPNHGYLTHWAEQGVLLLNSVLTVEQGKASSHQGKGWEQFTDYVIEVLNNKKENLVFLLWGSYAQNKGEFIDGDRHLVLKTTHPSPFSAHRGFLGCRHFSKTNTYLINHGIKPIDWQLSDQ